MTERIGLTDDAALAALENRIIDILKGNAKDPGMYFSIARGVKDWDTYQRMVGQVHAFEAVIAEIMRLRNEGGIDGGDRVTFGRTMGFN